MIVMMMTKTCFIQIRKNHEAVPGTVCPPQTSNLMRFSIFAISVDWEIRKMSINVISDCSCNHHRAVRLIWFVSSLDIWDEYDEEVDLIQPGNQEDVNNCYLGL